jgi:hypothetical protein
VPASALPGLSNVVAIAAGSDHDLTLLGQGPPILQVSASSPHWSANDFSLVVTTDSGRTYRLEFQAGITNGTWRALPLVPGNGFLESLSDTNASASERFYRLRRC